MNASLKQEFILKMGELSALFGYSHVVGQIYGMLYLSPSEQSLDDVKDALNVSKATVSLNIRELFKWGAVKRVWKLGTRRDYYEAEIDFLKIFNTRLVDALLRRFRVFEEAGLLAEGDQKISKSTENKVIEERIKAIKKLSRIGIKALETVKDSKKLELMKKWLL